MTYSSDDYFIIEALVFQKEGINSFKRKYPSKQKVQQVSKFSLQGFSAEENFAHWSKAASAAHVWSLALSVRNRASESENDDLILVAD